MLQAPKVAITCDDIGHSRHSHPLDSAKEFVSVLDKYDVIGTFFVIPNDGGDSALTEEPDLVSALGTIIDKGHEIAMHGYTHHIFEFGPPRPFVLRTDATAIYLSEMERRDQELLSTHTLESHARKIKSGLDIFRKALNLKPVGFRAGWGSYNSNLFEVLSEEGFLYDSSVFKMELVNKKPYIIPKGKLLELPMDPDFAWCLSHGDLDSWLSKAKETASNSVADEGVFVPLLHHWAMWKYERLGVSYDFTTGFKLLDSLIKHLKFEAKADFMTMHGASKAILGE
jgi:peptidoglycan/xylan/chitin deacetylase (PgdA/CDA1 family)